jgi:hypothetical protein
MSQSQKLATRDKDTMSFLPYVNEWVASLTIQKNKMTYYLI